MFLYCTLLIRLLWCEANFTQTRISSAFAQPQIEQGYFRFAQPDSLVWRYDGRPDTEVPVQLRRMIISAIENDTEQLNSRRFRRYFSSCDIDYTDEGVARKVTLVETTGDSTVIQFTNMRYEPLLRSDTHIQ